MITKLVFATGNEGKFKEVKELFADCGVKVVSLKDFLDVPDVVEDRVTFEENAIKKAREIYEQFGLPVVADDSGLAVDALNGAPGVYSARYAGENCTFDDNNKKLLKELSKAEIRTARFLCYSVFYDGEVILVAKGTLEGEIIKELTGSKGFGYDPVFKPLKMDRTLAEMTVTEKNEISHRGKAFRKLKEMLTKLEYIK